MPETRRQFLKRSALLGAAALLKPSAGRAQQGPAENFTAGTFEESLKRLYGDRNILATDRIRLKLPRIAENGAVVPITVSTSLVGVTAISILVEKNPVPLAATFRLQPPVEPMVSARIKMATSCAVVAVVEAGGLLYSNRQNVKVTIGGCGG